MEQLGVLATPEPEGAVLEPALEPHAREPKKLRARAKAVWAAVRAGIGALLGLLPHVLHHVGIFAGTALLAGLWGNAVLYIAGLLLSIPMLRRLRRRYRSRIAPAIGAVAFTGLFLLSALVIGPAFSGTQVADGPRPGPTTAVPSSEQEHAGHHR